MKRYVSTVDTLILRDRQDGDGDRYVQIDDEGDFWLSAGYPGSEDVRQILIRRDQLPAFIALLKKAQLA